MSNRISQHQPYYEQGIFEFQEIARIENTELTALSVQSSRILENQFVLTADEDGILLFEKLYGITAAEDDSLEFRRDRILGRIRLQPPLTERFLRQQLDNLIGAGQYELVINPNGYTIRLATAVENQSYAQEVSIIVNKIKPANMVYINEPLLADSILENETIIQFPLISNYRLGTSWNLGQKPFKSTGEAEVIKLATITSIQDSLLAGTANYVKDTIAKVLLNGTVVISNFVTKQVNNNTVELEYKVTSNDVNTITLLQLCKADDTILTSVSVYVPIVGETLVNHKIKISEGGNN